MSDQSDPTTKKVLNDQLQAEYLHLQKTVEDFDGRAITIKAWSVTFGAAVLVGTFATGARDVLLIVCGSALVFWFIEAQWKSFQERYYDRITTIESYFSKEEEPDKTIRPFQISRTWGQRRETGAGKLRAWLGDNSRLAILLEKSAFFLMIALRVNVLLPHAIIAVVAIALWWFSRAPTSP